MSGKKHVLIIEDDIAYGELLQDALQHFGYTVGLAYSATGGLDYLRNNPVDVLISDINLPAANGLELAERMLEECPNLPVILMSSLNDFRLVSRALASGVSDYLVKPVPVTDLPDAVEKAIERKRIEQTRFTKTLNEQIEDSINMLMCAMEAKNALIAKHTRQVVAFAEEFAGWLKLSPESQLHLSLSAKLHEIGKLGMPDKVLHRAEKMTALNYDPIYDYCIIGSNIIGEMDGLQDVAEAIRHQRERYDGGGFPGSLKKDEIPLYSRIISLLDAFTDALQGQTMGALAALNDLRSECGQIFDPTIFQQFEAMQIYKLSAESVSSDMSSTSNTI
ncbi:MAG: HD domain-containing phosphohydrolase [Calditrichota bacterium]